MFDVCANSRWPVHQMQCMEVWGGNGAIHSAISVPGIDAWISSAPYRECSRGGDIHYVSMCGGGRISRFAIVDVSGHGDAVSQLAQNLRSLMRKYINTLDQTRFARALNHELLQLDRTGRFATALLATYFAPTDHLIICNAGHPRPLWYRAASRSWEVLDPAMPQRATEVANLPLGVIERTDYIQFAVKLERGDLVLIYTDSLIESRSPDGDLLGEAGLLQLARQLDPDEPVNLDRRLLAAVAEYHDGAPVEDDETLLVLHHNAADPPRQSIGQRILRFKPTRTCIQHRSPPHGNSTVRCC